MAFTRPLGPFATEIESQDYVRLSGTLAVLEHWSTMLPRFSDHEIFQIEPYLKFKTEELATLVIAGTRNEQTRTLDRLSVLREGRLGDIEECEDHINNIFRAQLLHLSGTFAASSASVNSSQSGFVLPWHADSIYLGSQRRIIVLGRRAHTKSCPVLHH